MPFPTQSMSSQCEIYTPTGVRNWYVSWMRVRLERRPEEKCGTKKKPDGGKESLKEEHRQVIKYSNYQHVSTFTRGNFIKWHKPFQTQPTVSLSRNAIFCKPMPCSCYLKKKKKTSRIFNFSSNKNIVNFTLNYLEKTNKNPLK